MFRDPDSILKFGIDTQTHTLEKVAPWSAISGCFAVCISPLELLQIRP